MWKLYLIVVLVVSIILSVVNRFMGFQSVVIIALSGILSGIVILIGEEDEYK